MTLPDGVNPEGIAATLKDGVLKITAPRKPESRRQAIKIEAKAP